MLTSRRLLLLLVAAVLVIGGAWWLSTGRQSPREQATESKVLPDLKARINDVTEVRLVTAGDVTAVTLRKVDDKRWGVMERGGYAADRQKLSRLLMNLGDLETVEQKTATPANYARLGVEDVKDEKATGVRIDVVGLGKPVSLIVGTPAGTRGSYVRPADSPASLLAEPQLSLEREPANWLDRRLLDIPQDRVQQIRVKTPQSTYTAAREKADSAEFTVSPLPKGRELSSPSAANTLAGALGNLTFDDVSSLAATTLPADAEHSESEYRLFDGTVVTINGTKTDNDHWLTVSVAYDEAQHQRFAAPATPATPAKDEPGTGAQTPQATTTEPTPDDQAAASGSPTATATTAAKPRTATDVKEEAEAMAQRVDGWLFKIPAYKYETLFQPLDDMLKTP